MDSSLQVPKHRAAKRLSGAGQSLDSAHLDAVSAPTHKFIDPNIWFDETEMRKQIEQSAGCFILTTQDAPQAHRKLREDNFKETMSTDPIAGQRTYGYQTKTIVLIGWKKFETNRVIGIAGITEDNFQSMLRRSLVRRPLARFIDAKLIGTHYPDAAQDGYFAKEETSQ